MTTLVTCCHPGEHTLHTGFFFHFTVYSWPVLSGFLLQGHLPKWSRQKPNPRLWPTLHRLSAHALRSQAHPWQRCRKPKPYFPFLCAVKLWCKNCTSLGGLLGELQETVNIKGLGQCLVLGEVPVNVTSCNYSPELPQTHEYAWSLGRITPPSSHWALPLLSPYSDSSSFWIPKVPLSYLSYINLPQKMWTDVVISLPLLNLTSYKQFMFFSELKKKRQKQKPSNTAL